MRTLPVLLVLAFCASAGAQGTYTNFIRQVQIPSGVQWDATVAANGEQASALQIDEGGARFELWTVNSSPVVSYLLDTRFVSTYAPAAEVVITSEDPYPIATRTRADRPFQVEVTVNGLLAEPSAPEPSKSVKLLRHVQSYGPAGVGDGLDRTQAALISQSSITQNGKQKLSFELSAVPGADRSKIRGEERFSVFSLADELAPESQLASRHIQIWPVADGSISGIAPNQKVRLQLPKLTISANDIYPGGLVYAQVYRGEARLGVEGTKVPGTSYGPIGDVPESRVVVLDRYDSVFDGDGRWTMELLTLTPFGTDRLAHVTFDLDREISINGTLTTIE